MAVCQCRQNVFCPPTLLLLGVILAESSQLHKRFKPFISIIPYRFRLENLDETLKDKLTIECGTPEPPNEDIELISSLRIKRILVEARIGPPSIKNPELLVEAQNSGDRQAKIKSAGGSHNYTVSGEVPRSENEGRISITFKQAGCWDSADYVCEFIRTDITRSVSHLESSTKLLTVDPTGLSMKVEPALENIAVFVGAKVNITCEGNVGTIKSNEYKTEWGWQFRDVTVFAVDWMEYDGSKLDISAGPVIKERCFERWSSTLSLTLKPQDTVREYRCLVRRRFTDSLDIESFEHLAMTLSMQTLFGKREEKSVSMAAVLGITSGLLVIVCSTCFSIIWYRRWRKKRNAVLIEIEIRKAENAERRKDLTTSISSRKCLHVDGQSENYDQMLAKLNKSGTAPSAPNDANPGQTTPSSATPAKGQPAATPETGQPAATPATGQPAATPATGQLAATGQPAATPATGQPAATPATGKPAATPAAVVAMLTIRGTPDDSTVDASETETTFSEAVLKET